jgi:hypothetical protein
MANLRDCPEFSISLRSPSQLAHRGEGEGEAAEEEEEAGGTELEEGGKGVAAAAVVAGWEEGGMARGRSET